MSWKPEFTPKLEHLVICVVGFSWSDQTHSASPDFCLINYGLHRGPKKRGTRSSLKMMKGILSSKPGKLTNRHRKFTIFPGRYHQIKMVDFKFEMSLAVFGERATSCNIHKVSRDHLGKGVHSKSLVAKTTTPNKDTVLFCCKKSWNQYV